MERLTMYERLLTLPVFQGMSRDELSQVMAHVKLDFVKFGKGEEVVCQGDACRSLVCVISGTLSATLMSGDGRFTMYEHELPGITVIEPYNMFGFNRKYSRTYSFATEGETLILDRDVLLEHILNSRIAKVNILNSVCGQYQKAQKFVAAGEPDNVQDKVRRFFLSVALVPKGRKQLKMKMTDLADWLKETRLNVSVALNNLQAQGLLTLSRGMIEIHDMALM